MIGVLSEEDFEVNHLCGALEVSRSAYYGWKTASPNLYEQLDQRLGPMIKDVFHQHRRRYGARRIACELQERGERCSRSKVRKIMDPMNLLAIQPKSFKPRTTQSNHRLGYNSNLLLEGIEMDRLNQVWVGDITYVALQSRFAYLALLMDLYSRKIVGWSFDENMEASLVIKSLKDAIGNRQPATGLIHHSDPGGQYAAKEYRAILSRAQMRQSMSRAGDCYDNAFMESCFGTLKTELEMATYQSYEEARREIQEYINYYNALRRHSSIDYLSPNRFETTCQT
ncbi:IS3 family transposase [Adhaeretor mobilis]|uniref:Integrase core domain protein n=1 Tax=Adhaeretor mobilis TaxID=1930276 RepID=A0A517MWB0_9BACT|nr:IS3 family transposase [Adhaeretor mobilis]QDS99087.1 Integrase core domain protein [Adhaeretor mobilis]